MLHINYLEVRKQFSFLQFIQGGTQLCCCIAIDFTASNGNPSDPASLHYSNPQQPSQYALALQAVGEIIADYDRDQLFPAYGFGAALPPNGSVSHCFHLNGLVDNANCARIEGVMAAYYSTLGYVSLCGPTNFSPIINHVASFARAVEKGTKYYILLIITDGIITDMPQTCDAIVQASNLPLSIIIVGVGDADFDNMHELDSDDDRLKSHGREAVRDIVQFVPFREFYTRNSTLESKQLLAKAVLAEIPDQLVSYMQMTNIEPHASAPPYPLAN